MAYGLLYICTMIRFSPIYWCAGLLGFALLTDGCGGRSVGKNMARDLIVGAHADALAKDDVQVLGVTQVGSDEAVVEVQLHTAFRLHKINGEWVVREVRVGQGQWESLDDVLRSLGQVKIEETRRSLEKIAAAIDAYRQKNGRLPAFRNYVELSDALYPVYLSPLIREDAWKRPLVATSAGPDEIRLVSAGPDGKLGTPDDIEINRSYR